ncbi:MAG: hypothetical protein IV108_01415 [Burkholderiales bacterium]|nr:hypothetical protein [Burkholderiales bacterium]
MKPSPKIHAISRPVRVAYLIEDGLDAPRWLNSIFASCLGRHGGRQSLVVPVENALIPQRYANWLRVLDPDVVFALTYDNAALVQPLADLLADTVILGRERKRDTLEEHPSVGLEEPALTALSWLPFLKISSGAIRARPELILDSYPLWRDDGFVTDNFGSLSSSLEQFPVHRELADYVRPLMLTPPDPPANRWHFGNAGHEEINSAYEILPRLHHNNSLLTLGYLSNLYAQRHRVEHPWRDSFCLVVGDSFLDRVTCWNSALLYDDAQHQTYKTLRVPAATRLEPDNTKCIAEFLRNCNWLGQNNSSSRVSVRSHSLNKEELEAFAEQLRGPSMSIVNVARIDTAEDCCPAGDKSIHFVRPTDNASSEVAIGESPVAVSVPSPIQVKYCTGAHPIMSRGSWYVDLQIDRLNDNSRFDNVRDVWTLPKRPQLLRVFHKKRPTRILRTGDIGIEVHKDIQALEVSQPEDQEVFYSLLNDAAQYAYRDMRKVLATNVAYKFSKPSDKGRYLQGVLGMFGSLSDAEAVLGGHFWRTQFETMATPATEQYPVVITKLQRRLKAKSGTLVIEDGAGWQNLAERVIQMSSDLRVPRLTTQYTRLLEAWKKELTAAIEVNTHIKDQSDAILADAPEGIKSSLGYLCERGVFYRGHEWVCRHCSHRNWVSVDALKNVMPCEICQQEHHLPVDLTLDFRLNEFLATCLREHDTLSVIWALSALRREAKKSFIFAPQTALFRDYPENQGMKADRELDVVCIVDGKFFIGEAKPRVDQIAKSDIEDLAATANELKADVAILTALSGEARQMEGKVAQLRELLSGQTLARSLISEWNEEPSLYL